MGEEEKDYPPSREPDAGLDSRTLRSRPEPKTEGLSHPGALLLFFFLNLIF